MEVPTLPAHPLQWRVAQALSCNSRLQNIKRKGGQHQVYHNSRSPLQVHCKPTISPARRSQMYHAYTKLQLSTQTCCLHSYQWPRTAVFWEKHNISQWNHEQEKVYFLESLQKEQQHTIRPRSPNIESSHNFKRGPETGRKILLEMELKNNNRRRNTNTGTELQKWVQTNVARDMTCVPLHAI